MLILSELDVSMKTGHGETVLELWLRILIVIIRLTNVRFIKSKQMSIKSYKDSQQKQLIYWNIKYYLLILQFIILLFYIE